MTRTTILVERVSVSFPRHRVTRGPFHRALLGLVRKRPFSETHFTALEDVSLEVAQGEVVGLIGKNGAGKSTLLRIIAGIYRPDRGRALSAGRVLLLSSLSAGFNVNLSGRENAYLYGSILGHSRSRMNELMDGIIEFSGLADFIDQPLRTYSNGMRARLGFATASAVMPDILLIDEILAVGDAEFKERSGQRIREMVANAHTVLIASHSTSLLKQVCTRGVLVEHGRIVEDGPVREVLAVYTGKTAAKSAERAAREEAKTIARMQARAEREAARAAREAARAEREAKRAARAAAKAAQAEAAAQAEKKSVP